MDAETSAAVNSLSSIFDPPDAPSTSSSMTLPGVPAPLRFGPSCEESSDEEARRFILKNDPFVPKKAESSGKLRKTPRTRNAPVCKHSFKKGPRKGETCAAFCRIGEDFCGKHRPPAEKKTPYVDLETFALKMRFHRLKLSKKYRLLQVTNRIVILEESGRLLKVKLPGYLLNQRPKCGSYLVFQGAAGKGEPAKAMWEDA